MNSVGFIQKRFLFVFLLLFGPYALADLSIQLNFQTELHQTIYGHTSHEQHGTCNMGGGWTENHEPVGYELASRTPPVSITASGSTSYIIDANVVPYGNTRLRTTTVSNTITKEGNTETVSILLQDSARLEVITGDHGGDCDTDHWFNKIESPRVAGDIKITYNVPPDVHAVIVHRGQKKSSFEPAFDKNVVNALLENENPEGQARIIWVTPNTQISQVFHFSEANAGALLSGDFTMSFEPILADLLPKNVGSLSKSIHDQLSGSGTTAEGRMALIRQLMSTVALNDQAKAFYSAADTSVVGELASAEFELANSPITGDDAPDLRVAAFLSQFRTAAWILDHLMPFCQQLSIDLPVVQQKFKVNGLLYSYFLFQRALMEVNSYDSSPYKSMLNHLSQLQKDKLTYESAMENVGLKKSLNDALKVLKHIPMSATQAPFVEAESDLEKIYSHFENLGNGASNAKQLLQWLTRLGNDERAVAVGLFERLRQFNQDSEKFKKPIDVSDLVSSLDKLEAERKSLVGILAKNKALYSAAKDGAESVSDQMARLVTFNTNLFSEPFKDTGKFLEPLRTSFVNEPWFTGSTTVKAIERAELCALDGGQQ